MNTTSAFRETGELEGLQGPGGRSQAGARRLRVFGCLAVAVAIAELVLCFRGPIAFVQRPSLVLFPPFSAGLTEQEVDGLASFAERGLALTRSYEIVSLGFVEEYYVRTDPEFDKARLKPSDYQQAQELAQELEIDRFGLSWAYHSTGQWELSISIRDTEDGSVLRNGRFVANSYEDMLRGIGTDGQPFDVREQLAATTRGLSFTDWLVLTLLGLQLLAGLLALIGREPALLVEIVWAPALILFVFAYIWALSANMDYVQRYIASSGNLRLAESTAVEQLHAVLRYGPLLVLNGVYYVWKRLRATAPQTGLQRYVTRWSLPWVVLSAALFGFSFPSALALDGLGPLAWVSLVPLLLVLLTSRPAMGVFYGVLFGALQAMIVNYWLGTYDYVTLHMVTIAFAVQYLLFMVPLVWLIKASGKWGFLTVPVAWLLYDYVRSIGLLAYPWGLIGVTQYRFLPLIQIASVGGVWAVDFVVLLGNAALAWALAAASLGWSWRRLPGRIQAWLPLIVFAAFFAVCLAGGGAILFSVRHRLYGHPDTPRATVVLLQQNTDPRKHEYEENTDRLIALTDQALASLPEKADLIAWPEGGFKLDITYWGDPQRADTSWGREVREFREYQRGLGTWLATGTQDHEVVTLVPEVGQTLQKDFNSSVLLDADGQISAFYHKIRLVPFSEYFPLDKEKFAGLYDVFQKYDISDWDIGSERLVYQHEKMRFLTPLCFEDVFSDHVRRFVLQDVDLILNMSNDYWSLSPVEGRQHGLHALFRAVENQRPLLRSTCSGYTVYVDATGQIQPGSPEPYTPGYTIARVPLPPLAQKPLTLYTRWGDWFPRACAAAMTLAGLAAGIRLLVRGIGRAAKRRSGRRGTGAGRGTGGGQGGEGGNEEPGQSVPASPLRVASAAALLRTSLRSAFGALGGPSALRAPCTPCAPCALLPSFTLVRAFGRLRVGALVLCILISPALFSPRLSAQTPSDAQSVVRSNTEFAVDLYRRLGSEDGNLIFSPYSMSGALALTYGGARGQTARQMAAVLHFSLEADRIHPAFAEVQARLDAIQQAGKVQLAIANSLWPQEQRPYLPEYLELARNFYHTEITPVDYTTEPETAARRINSWVEEKTRGRIQNAVPPSLPRDTRLVLVNAIYFKGEWASRFEESATKQMPFHPTKNQTIEVPTMHQKTYLKYGEDELLQVLEKPYAGGDLSMVILLPREIDGLRSLGESLTADKLAQWSRNMYRAPVNVSLPRFRLTCGFDLAKVLKALGMTDAFERGTADFSGMDGERRWSYINFAVHKAFVEVNEEGTEAAAVTAGGGGCFPAGTEVLTSSGPCAIETVQPGTKVYACDLTTGEWRLATVRRRLSHPYEADVVTVVAGETTVQATGNHPFYVLRGARLANRPPAGDVPAEERAAGEQGRWVEARDLEAGDLLKCRNGEGLVITSLSSRQEKTEVYNLEVEGYHNYAVHPKGILVHNKGSAEAPQKEFRADHPFLFLIRDNLTGSILFMGRVADPNTGGGL